MAKAQRDKGSRVERKILALFRENGMQGKRTGFLPALGIPTDGDLEIEGMTVEVKARKKATGFKKVKDWLGKCDALVLVEDHREPLIVQRFSDWMEGRENVQGPTKTKDFPAILRFPHKGNDG